MDEDEKVKLLLGRLSPEELLKVRTFLLPEVMYGVEGSFEEGSKVFGLYLSEAYAQEMVDKCMEHESRRPQSPWFTDGYSELSAAEQAKVEERYEEDFDYWESQHPYGPESMCSLFHYYKVIPLKIYKPPL